MRRLGERTAGEPTRQPLGVGLWTWPVAAVLFALFAIPGMFSVSHVFFVRDLTTSFLPHHLWFRRTLLEGHLPIWNPFPGSGYSTVSDPTFQTLFPLTLPLRVLPPILGFNWIVALPFPVAALGMYLFLRRRSSPPAACLGATVVAASGVFLSTANTPNLAWSCAMIPWVLLGADALAERRELRSFASLAVACALMILAGEPVTFAATAGLAVLYGAFACGEPSCGWRTRSRVAALSLAAILVGALLGAVQILPLLDAHGRSIRAAGALIDTWSLHPARLAELVVPFFFGKWVGRPEEVTQWLFAVNDGREPFLLSLYVGAGALLAALTGALATGQRPWARFWCVVGPLSLVAAFGTFTPIYPAARIVLPVLAVFRFPSKYAIFTTLAVGALAALGFEAISHRERISRRRLALPLTLSCALAALAALGLAVALAQPRTAIELAERLGQAWSLPNPAAASTSFLGRIGAGAPHLLVASIVGGLALWLSGSAGRKARIAQAAFFILVAADLIMSNASINPSIDASALEPFEWVNRTRQHPADRVFVSLRFAEGLAPMDDAVRPPQYPADLSPVVHQALYDTVLCNSWACGPVRRALSSDLTGLRPREYLTLLREFTAADRPTRYRFLSWAGTRYYLVSAPPPIPAAELARLPKLGDVALYESPPSGSRVAVVSATEIDPDTDRQIHRLFEATFDPSATVILDAAPPSPGGKAGTPLRPEASIVEESATSVIVDAAAPEDGYLVLLDAYDPNWGVEVDGEPASLLRADGAFRAVRLSPGRHRVRFWYLPRPLIVGGGISLATALALVAIAWFSHRSRSRGTAAATPRASVLIPSR